MKFIDQEDVHLSYGHPGQSATNDLSKLHPACKKNLDCEVCNRHNLNLQHSTRPSQKWAENPNDQVFMDLYEPHPSIPGYDGSKHAVMIVDDYTGQMFTYTIPDKEARTVLDVFEKYHAYAERWHYPHKVKVVHTDFGKEFDNNRFKEEIEAKGITHEFGGAYIHYQNGRAERAIRTIENKAKKMLESSGMDEKFWPEAAKAGTYLHGRCPKPGGISPHILWYGRYDARQLYRFGAEMFYREQAPTAKGKERQKEAIFLGYDRNTTGYRLLDCESGKVIRRNFIGYRKKRTINAVRRLKEKEIEPLQRAICLLRQVKVKENIIIPRNESEAMWSKQSESWKREMENELHRMEEERVFEYVKFNGQRLISTSWTYDYKVKENRFSARLVARGDHQLSDQYNDTFAPTLPMSVLRLLLCIALNFNLIVSERRCKESVSKREAERGDLHSAT